MHLIGWLRLEVLRGRRADEFCEWPDRLCPNVGSDPMTWFVPAVPIYARTENRPGLVKSNNDVLWRTDHVGCPVDIKEHIIASLISIPYLEFGGDAAANLRAPGNVKPRRRRHCIRTCEC